MLGKRLKELRGKRTQEEVARIFGISRARYSHYENDRVQPDNDLLRKMADFFGVSVDYLLGRVENPKEILTDDEREMYDAVGNMPFEKLRELFEFPEAEEEDIKDIIKQIELIKIRRNQIKNRG
ncbi:helix-turn-helix domain-containing protein [Effusibacillus dendaii]|uniref:HTH cro/C1-type domain-containing protein n=1 Tax=Effusibacillus dendaii TaxID=2743772 RepID=A0A7I8D929_9BACL|nr:helix-turn-helix transcriptional regulator [Effusibacillus dendaii]BCJ86507.1 hypothetical protein skT53_14920 [Effusibacillus dendaii]